jgi:hypothetical protein
VRWLRRLIAGLSSRRPGLIPRPVHVGFVVDTVALGQVFSPGTSVFPSQYYSTNTKCCEIYLIPNRLREIDVSVAAVEDIIRIRFICCLFNDAVSSSGYRALSGRMNDDFKECGCARSLNLYILTFAWRD